LMGASKTGIARIRELSADASMSDPPTISAPTATTQAFNPNSAY
jgi:hypothetical protein